MAKVYSYLIRKQLTRKSLTTDFFKEIVEEIHLRITSGRILDVGTGPGYLPLEIGKRVHNLEIIGVDISPAMVKIARTNAENIGLSGRVKFQVGNAAKLPFEDRYFDFVMSTDSFHHWLNPVECIKEIYRVLKENGEAWIYEIRQDTTKEVNTQVRRRYGCFSSFHFLNIVRAHSSVTLKEVEKILLSSEISFYKKNIESKGIRLKMRLSKGIV